MAAAAPGATKSGPSADSYIGSLISLTSKSEIRYEGVLFNINTEESSIGLQNVRSFGTEGRRKDGKQIPPSDKIYEYILFRGSDIKDLQVKSSPSQTAPSIHSDPAVIQSHYPRPVAPAPISAASASVGRETVAELSSHTAQGGGHTQTNYSRPVAPLSTSVALPSVGSGIVPELSSSHTAQTGAPPSAQSVPPLYQPTAYGSGLAAPAYLQGFYAPTASGGLPHLQQPPSLRPLGQPPGLPLPPSMQQPLQYPAVNPSVPSGSHDLPSGSPYLPGASASPSFPSALPRISPSPSSHPNLPGIGAPQLSGSNMALPSVSTNLPEFPLWPPAGSGQSLTSSKFPSFPEATSLALDSLHRPPFTSLPSAAAPVASLPPFPSPLTSPLDSTVGPASEPKSIPGIDLAQQAATSLSAPMASGSSSSALTEAPGASLLTSGQLLQPGPAAVSPAQPSQVRQQIMEVNAASAGPQKQAPPENKDAILPLPAPFDYKAEFASRGHAGHRRRRGGRGNTLASSATHFTEDFDFTAMNEKFNKDEVWGHLGKGHSPTGDNNEGYPNEDRPGSSEPKTKPVYVKDDFFDSLSCNAFDHARRRERGRFSEKMRTNTETFGEFSRHRPGRGGGGGGGRGYRGGGGGGGGGGGSRGRGFFYGRGNEYVGRGHGGHDRPD